MLGEDFDFGLRGCDALGQVRTQSGWHCLATDQYDASTIIETPLRSHLHMAAAKVRVAEVPPEWL